VAPGEEVMAGNMTKGKYRVAVVSRSRGLRREKLLVLQEEVLPPEIRVSFE
jgi:hypothetical protein